MLKVVIDAGHGINTPGKRSPDGMREFQFNSVVAKYMKAELSNYEGVEIMFTHDPDGSTDVSLNARTNKANSWGADVFVSIHANANTGSMGNWGGIDTFVYTTKPKESVALANVVQSNLIKATKLKNRGVKPANFHVLRESHMTAILIEHGFMDSYTDLPYLKSDSYRKTCGVTNARSLAQFYNLKRKSSSKSSTSSSSKSSGSVYTVVKGDNLWEISQKYKITVDQLKKMNNLSSNVIYSGQKLIVDSNNYKTYKVVKGDTLWEIAKDNGMSVDELKKINGLNSNIINIGQSLKVKA